ILQLAFNDKEQKRLDALAVHFAPSLLRPVNAQQASQLAGVTLEKGGLFYPEAGWIHPPALCQALTQNPLITIQNTQQAMTLTQVDQQWQVHAESGRSEERRVGKQ